MMCMCALSCVWHAHAHVHGTLAQVGRQARAHVEGAFGLEVFGEKLEAHLRAVAAA